MNLIATFRNVSVDRASDMSDWFPSFPASSFPAQANTTFAQSFGGWSAQPSNTMFTEGEFSAYRAYGVFTQEQAAGAPAARNVAQDVPQCGKTPSGTDVFGLLYGGAAYAEDLLTVPGWNRSSQDATPPLHQGVALFAKAYNAWLPCFNSSREETGGSSSGAARGIPEAVKGSSIAAALVAVLAFLLL
jgi:hypothetical protein